MMLDDIPSTLTRYRAASRLTQAAVSKRAGLTSQYISDVERGHNLPSYDALERILAVYGYQVVIVPIAEHSELTALDKDALLLLAQAGHDLAVMAGEALNERAEGSLWMRLQQLERTVGRYWELLATLGIKEGHDNGNNEE